MTQEELSFEANIDLTYVGGIERGKRNPSLLVMARIAKALSVALGKLIAECDMQLPYQYSSASISVRTRSVTVGFEGSIEAACIPLA